MNTTPIISIRNVVNRFGKQTVHNGVSLDVMRGEIMGIAGDSGSGKSVLIKTIAGLHKPDEGEVKINGKHISDITAIELASLIGMLFQEGALFSSLSVAQNIMLPLREYTRLSEEAQVDLAQLKLALVGMKPEVASKYPSELSGGMTRRIAMARALAMDPLILFLDEPTSGLDPINASGFDELLLNLNQGLRVTVVLVTHDLNTLYTICDRVAVLVDQNIMVDTLPNLLKKDHPWIRKFFQGPRGEGAAFSAAHHGEAHGNR